MIPALQSRLLMLADIQTPAYVLDAKALERNMALARRVRAEAGCRMLLAVKAFALPAAFPLMRDSLDGTTASGEYEARLGQETFGKQVHCYSPAYLPDEVERCAKIATDVYFNSARELAHYAPLVKATSRAKIGLRVNPGFSNATLGGALYDPCAPFSRFGEVRSNLDSVPWDHVDILHVHALCESLHDGSVRLIEHVGRELGAYVRHVKAVNFGGGHFIGKPGYDIDKLIAAIVAFKSEFGVDVILEPGAGLVVDTGYLVSRVIGLHTNEKEIAILDASASCHMPDVLEVPYRPQVMGAGTPGEFPHSYILGGKTCMTGDIIGEYSFNAPLKIGDRLIFTDMMQYSFIKNNSFNGVPLPNIGILDAEGQYKVVRTFGYEDFAGKLR